MQDRTRKLLVGAVVAAGLAATSVGFAGAETQSPREHPAKTVVHDQTPSPDPGGGGFGGCDHGDGDGTSSTDL